MWSRARSTSSFGHTLTEWNRSHELSKRQRLAAIQRLLGIRDDFPATLHYQLLQRMAAAVVEAQRFSAKTAVALIHSFSEEGRWFEDYAEFVALYGLTAERERLVLLTEVGGIKLYAGWVTGEQEFLEA